MNLGHIRIGRIFHGVDDLRLEVLSFLHQFSYALRIRFGGVWKSLIATGLSRGIRPSFDRLIRLIHTSQ
jgi:hypothetical protein